MTSLSAENTFHVVRTTVADTIARDDAEDVFVNIAILIDAEGIIEAYKGRTSTPDSPLSLNPVANYLTMAARHKNSASAWDAELKITIPRGGIVRWREETMSFNTRYRAQLYRYHANDDERILSDVRAFAIPVELPLPNRDDPLNPATYSGWDYYWQANATKPGDVTYHFDFMILDDENTKLGYYRWDPYVHVT
ncbi:MULTISPECIES: AidA/PixA family protein [Saccharothrix]|uniref:AidA/PixA family protein n=1 Tax=Saccharothrix TaxID=2071 RepID=UPI00093C01C3|nr:AidA/PixA family protein [Saccharothrix sp. CB00851]OKI36609.1 hypothetical protein A6A25_21295 [Saccharothrix sp. CB00851]